MRIIPLTLRGIAGCVVCAGVIGAGALAQEPRVAIEPRSAPPKLSIKPPSNLRLDVTMVLVPVSVKDPTDRPVLNLPADSFRIYEDNIEQKIASFALEEGPISIGILFDASTSMKPRMAAALNAVEQFLRTAAPGDEFNLVSFSDQPNVVMNFTQDINEILAPLASVQAAGWTALHDALCLSLQKMKKAKNARRALLILSDGGDNNSRYSESEVRNMVRESDVRVYSIGLFERPKLLENLAADSGGRAYLVHKLDDLPDVVETLSRDLRSQYVLGYSSNNGQKDGKYRKVRVELIDKLRRIPLSIFWRRGYYAPGD